MDEKCWVLQTKKNIKKKEKSLKKMDKQEWIVSISIGVVFKKAKKRKKDVKLKIYTRSFSRRGSLFFTVLVCLGVCNLFSF